jgi:hypothetical protein
MIILRCNFEGRPQSLTLLILAEKSSTGHPHKKDETNAGLVTEPTSRRANAAGTPMT